MKLTMFAARQPVGVRLGMLILEGIVVVVMLVAQLLVLPGVSHYALYDQPEAVGPALAKVIPFLQATL